MTKRWYFPAADGSSPPSSRQHRRRASGSSHAGGARSSPYQAMSGTASRSWSLPVKNFRLWRMGYRLVRAIAFFTKAKKSPFFSARSQSNQLIRVSWQSALLYLPLSETMSCRVKPSWQVTKLMLWKAERPSSPYRSAEPVIRHPRSRTWPPSPLTNFRTVSRNRPFHSDQSTGERRDPPTAWVGGGWGWFRFFPRRVFFMWPRRGRAAPPVRQ